MKETRKKKSEPVRQAVPMDPAKVRAIRMVQYMSNAVPPECPAELTAGCIETNSGTHEEK
jgi:hypothetical protein